MVYRNRVTLKGLAHVTRNLVLILLISFGFGEAALRIVNRFNPSFVFYDASYNRFRARPGSNYYGFPVNSSGFHDVEFTEDKGEAFRIVAIGDSFAFGIVPYEHNFLTLLEQRLSAAIGPVEVLNMGIPRTGPLDHLALLVNEGLTFEPDMVLLSVFTGNDLLETSRELRDGRPLHTRSYVLSVLRVAFLMQPQKESGVLRNRRTYLDDQPTFDPDSHLEILKENAVVYLTGWEGFAPSIDAATAAFRRMADICHARDIALTVVLLPEETQLDRNLQRKLSTSFDLYPADKMDFQLPNRTLHQRLTALDIDHLDLLPAFQAGAEVTTLYKPRDTHWNIAGNRLAADAVAAHLLALGLPRLTAATDRQSTEGSCGGE